MSKNEEISHLEHAIIQLKAHVAQQDTEIFRLAKRLDTVIKRLQKLESRLAASGGESPIETDATPADERPPHY